MGFMTVWLPGQSLDCSILSQQKAVCPSHQWWGHSCAVTSELSYEQFCLLSCAGKVHGTYTGMSKGLFLCNVAGGLLPWLGGEVFAGVQV